ncbi:MAG: ATP-binding protein [Gammaproteobacteria bacterium]|nr:ATP-binding protein [Gammaproteobacteria bacterium]
MFKISARTVIELGSELISSDTIAFYELIKNAFDARSKNGVEIRFKVVLRRNSYLRIYAKATSIAASEVYQNGSRKEQAATTGVLLDSALSQLDPAAGPELVKTFRENIGTPKTIDAFIDKLDAAYRSLNTIEIADTGSGMSLEELKKNYLVIGTPSRKREVDQAITAKSVKSPFLGEKGIGRLSAMRLGERLRLETARQSDTEMNQLNIDWREFANLDAMIEDVPVEAFTAGLKPSPNWSGTILTISDLSVDWTENLLKAYAEFDFARITDPFVDQKSRPRIALLWNGNRITIPWMDKHLLEHAHAGFKGTYRIRDGEPVLSVTLEAFDLGFPHPYEIDVTNLTLPDIEGAVIGTSGAVPLSALTSVGDFDFQAYWYNRQRLARIDTIGDQRAVRELQKKWSGILLFRDGFRVFPYGDDDDDWLGLDRRAMGRSGYTLNKMQFVGRINITRTKNPQLLDQTNREGLRSTPEQQVFITLLQHVIQVLFWDFMKDVDRRYKQQPLDLGDVKAEVGKLESRAKVALSRVRKILPKGQQEVADELQEAFAEFQDLAARAQKRIDEVEADGRQMIQMAGVGLMVEVVAHELARASESALEAIEALRGKEMPPEMRSKLDTLRSEMKSVSKRLSVLDQLSVSGRQRSEAFDLGELIEELKTGHAAQFRRHNINFNFKPSSAPIRIRVVKGMLIQILENLISNSIYWMKMRASRESRYIPTISIQIDTEPLVIYYSDNGNGIAVENQEKIFRPFWSLKEKSKRRGLGLYIARENATYMGGRLSLSSNADPDTKRLHEFVLELPEGATVK